MDSAEHSSRREQPDYRDQPRQNGDVPLMPATARLPSPSSQDRPDPECLGYTLMVAGRRTGKTSFLRLLLDTTAVSPSVTQEQLASVAKFVQGCSGFTSHIRTVSVNVDLAAGDSDPAAQTLTLTLIDTPTLDFADDTIAQRTVSDILRHVDARFSESVEDVSASLSLSTRPYGCEPISVSFCRSTKLSPVIIMFTCECGAFRALFPFVSAAHPLQ